MRLAVFSIFATGRKEPFGELFARVLKAFEAAGLGATQLRFRMSDGAVATPLREAIGAPKPVSSIARVLKRYPDFERFAHRGPRPGGGAASIHMLSNITVEGTVEPVDPEPLLDIAAGVPRSFPFHKIWLHVTAHGFSQNSSDLPETPDAGAWRSLSRAGVNLGGGHPSRPGIAMQDAWWVNGRQRDIAGLRVIEADPAARKLPPLPPEIAALMAACGKVRKTIQVPLVVPGPGADAALPPHDARTTPAGEAVLAVIRTWRARLPELAEALPHDVAAQFEAPPRMTAGAPYGPRKPDLERVFATMGYSIRGETGSFILRRRTPNNLTVDLTIDVGTWSDHINVTLQVIGMLNGTGFRAAMSLPACRQAPRGMLRGVEIYGQMTVGTAERWRQLVENLGVLVRRLDQELVPEVEAITGPAPAWFRPETVA